MQPQRRFHAFCGCCLAGVVGLAPAAVRAADDAFQPVTPYRPSVSMPAQLSAPGQLEVEFGGVRMRSDDARRTALPYLLKLGFSREWGVVIGGEAHVWLHDEEGRASSIGDTTLTAKRAWLVDDATALGAELTATLPTATQRIGSGSGKADYTVNAIFSRDLGRVHFDANLNATRVGAADAGSGRGRFGASSSFSGPISAQWGLTGELSGSRQSGASSGAQWLAALTYSPSKWLTLDFGIAHAWRPSPASTGVFAGAVFPIAKLW